jgi:hypothetical protein
MQEVGEGHVGHMGRSFAVATTMPAVQVAPQGAFPKELAQLMLLDNEVLLPMGKFLCQFFP